MSNNIIDCSCNDTKCKFHPKNHNYGCDLCIQKNLKVKEIPSCFFKLYIDDLSKIHDFSIDSFVKFYNSLNNK